MAKPEVQVAVGVIRNAQQQVLLALRPSNKHQGGLWEFPGGKLDPGEEAIDALKRELYEELSITVTQCEPLINLRYHYPDLTVVLAVWQVTGFTGEAVGAEGQPIRWVEPSQLQDYSFPAANQPILRALQLPRQYWITPDLPVAKLLEGLAVAIERGAALIQLRVPSLAIADYQALAQQVIARWPTVQWMLKHPEQLTIAPSANVGFHLTATELLQLTPAQRASLAGGWLAASCHNLIEVEQAQQLQVDFITLSPVAPTASHPEQAALGWSQATHLTAQANCPVYWLGGLAPTQQAEVLIAGGQGIAAIRGFWPNAL